MHCDLRDDSLRETPIKDAIPDRGSRPLLRLCAVPSRFINAKGDIEEKRLIMAARDQSSGIFIIREIR